jgi:RNA polymerase sigma factor (sigma-70 family)
MNFQTIEEHYVLNRGKHVKRMYFRTGSSAAAEDIVQMAYERMLKYANTYNGDLIDKWFNTILNNSLRDYQNEEKGYTHREEEDEEFAENPSCPHYPEHVLREIKELIATKSTVQQEVLGLYFEYEYAPVDIAAITNNSYAMSHKMIQRFKEELSHLYH